MSINLENYPLEHMGRRKNDSLEFVEFCASISENILPSDDFFWGEDEFCWSEEESHLWSRDNDFYWRYDEEWHLGSLWYCFGDDYITYCKYHTLTYKVLPDWPCGEDMQNMDASTRKIEVSKGFNQLKSVICDVLDHIIPLSTTNQTAYNYYLDKEKRSSALSKINIFLFGIQALLFLAILHTSIISGTLFMILALLYYVTYSMFHQ